MKIEKLEAEIAAMSGIIIKQNERIIELEDELNKTKGKPLLTKLFDRIKTVQEAHDAGGEHVFKPTA